MCDDCNEFCKNNGMELRHHVTLISCSGYNANKLVCFTRSPQDLHQLPSQFPVSLAESSEHISKAVLAELVFSDTEQLVVQKLSTMTTFTNVSELLRSFAEHPTRKVVLIIVNMQETTRDVVNHLRIMIEEAESQSAGKKKIFALLLHFPSSKAVTHCYPAMFVQGWDFHYLDILGCSPGGFAIDIRDWFKQCCAVSSSSDCSLAIISQLRSLLQEAIPYIAARMFFGSHMKSSFNRPMSLPERIAALERLFFEKGVGEILCERFNSYWQPSVMVEYLERAAVLAREETSVNVIESLQTIFKNLFFDFLIYMICKMNEGMNIDVIFNPDPSPETSSLFLKILKIYPIPKLSELKMLLIANDSSSFTICDVNFSPPKFPFFCLVSSVVEKIVDQSRRDFNENVNMLGESADPSSSLFQTPEQRRLKTMVEVIQIVQDKLEDTPQVFFFVYLNV